MSNSEANKEPQILKLVPYDDPTLRVQATTVSFPLSVEDLELIKNMLYSVEEPQLATAKAPWPSAAGMAAPQWGVSKRIFVIRRKFLEDFTKTSSSHFEGSENFIVVINPEYSSLNPNDSVENEAIEGCFSVPNKNGIVRRFVKIEVWFQTMDGKNHQLILENWPARVFQHETDHTEGRLYDDKVANKCIKLMDV